MGGNQKQARRTKNNAKASSSSRCAELLENSSAELSSEGFPGFPVFSEDSNFPSELLCKDDIPPEISICLQKMFKKDSETKKKALDKFVECCEDISVDTLVNASKYWMRAYIALSKDPNALVREHAQKAFAAFFLKTKSSVDSYLKLSIGSWYLAMHDSHNGTAVVARELLASTLKPQKQVELLTYFGKEILSHLSQNILTSLPQNPIPQGEMDSYAEEIRTVADSLTALNKYVEYDAMASVPTDALKESLVHLLEQKIFWKLPLIMHPKIKMAWFILLIKLLDKYTQLLENRKKEVCFVIFLNLDYGEAHVQPVIWEALLFSNKLIDNWWTYVNPMEKFGLRKIWQGIQMGATYATSEFLTLLPLLPVKCVIPEALGETKFYSDLLINILYGLEKTTKPTGPHKLHEIVETFFDCMDVMLDRANDETRSTVLTTVFKEFIRNCLHHPNYQSPDNFPLHCLAESLKVWYAIGITNPKYTAATNSGLQSITEHMTLISLAMEGECPSVEVTRMALNAHLGMMKALRLDLMLERENSTTCGERIKYDKRGRHPPPLDPRTAESYLLQVTSLMHQMMTIYFEAAYNAKPHTYPWLYINALCGMCTFMAEEDYFELLQFFCKNCHEFLDHVKGVWLKMPGVDEAALIHIYFHLQIYSHDVADDIGAIAGSSQQPSLGFVKIFEGVDEEHAALMLEMCLNLKQKEKYRDLILKWFHSDYFKMTLSRYAADFFDGKKSIKHKAKILEILFKRPASGNKEGQTPNLDLMRRSVEKEVQVKVLKVLKELSDASICTSYISYPCVTHMTALANFLKVVFDEENDNADVYTEDVAATATLLSYLLSYVMDQKTVSQDRNESVYEAWITGVSSMAAVLEYDSFEFSTVVEEFAFVITRFLAGASTPVNKETAPSFLVYIFEFIGIAIRNACASDKIKMPPRKLASTITDHICYIVARNLKEYCQKHLMKELYKACVMAEFINGGLSFIIDDNFLEFVNMDLENETFFEADKTFYEIERVYRMTMLIAEMYYAFLPVGRYETSPRSEGAIVTVAADVKESEIDGPIISFSDPDDKNASKMASFLTFVVYVLALFRSYKKHYVHSCTYDIVSEGRLENMKLLVKRLVTLYKQELAKEIKLHMINKAFDNGEFWAKSLAILLTEILEEKDLTDIRVFCEKIETHTRAIPHANVNAPILSLHVKESLCEVTNFWDDFQELYKGNLADAITCLAVHLKFHGQNTLKPEQAVFLTHIQSMRAKIECTFDKNLTLCGAESVMLAVKMCRAMAEMLAVDYKCFTEAEGDFIHSCLVYWMRSVKMSQEFVHRDSNHKCRVNMPVSIMIEAVCRLHNALMKWENSDCSIYESYLALNAEKTQQCLIYLWQDISSCSRMSSVYNYLLMDVLSKTVMRIRKIAHIVLLEGTAGLKEGDPKYYNEDDDDDDDEETKDKEVPEALHMVKAHTPWLVFVSRLYTHYNPLVRYACYHFFRSISDEFYKRDLTNVDEMEAKLNIETFNIWMNQEVLKNVFTENFKLQALGSTKEPNPDTKSMPVLMDPLYSAYPIFHGYLLMWKNIICLCQKPSIPLRYRYSTYLKDQNYLDNFFHTLITLIPDGFGVDNKNFSDGFMKAMRGRFARHDLPDALKHCHSGTLADLTYNLLFESCRVLPLYVRSWWKMLERRDACRVEVIVKSFITPSLLEEEFKNAENVQNMDNFEVKGLLATKEMRVTYKVGDAKLEVKLKFPDTYPLESVVLDYGIINLCVQKLKDYSQLLGKFLKQQNTPVIDGILLWKKNMDKNFEGMEECHICFSILHSGSYQIPNKFCATCGKGFHPACVYKWFISSAKSTCPLCRRTF